VGKAAEATEGGIAVIEIIIKKYATEKYKETVQFTLTEEPTEVTEESSYGNNRKVTYKRTYEPREVEKTRQVERVLLKQEIANDELFNLPSVILAINNLAGGSSGR